MKESSGALYLSCALMVFGILFDVAELKHYAYAMVCVSVICKTIEDKK